jgi:hypothetical protein
MRNSSTQDFALFAAILGAFFALSGAYKIWRGFGTTGWNPVPGEITGNFVYETEEESEDEDQPMRTTWQSFYQPRVMYKYAAQGKEYESDCLQEGLFRLPFRQLAQKRVEDYRVGEAVMVYVSPRDPAQAVLRRGPPIDAYVLLASGVILLLLCWKFW